MRAPCEWRRHKGLDRGYDRALGLIDWRSTRKCAERSLEHVGLRIYPDITVSDLSRTERSLVAIARALAMNVDLLVLDEPTASLPTADVERLFDVLRHLRERVLSHLFGVMAGQQPVEDGRERPYVPAIPALLADAR